MTTIKDLMGRTPVSSEKTVIEGVQEALRHVRLPARPEGAPGDNRPLTFVEFVNLVNPKFIWYKHNIKLAAVLQKAIDGGFGPRARLMINMPPRHGKTEMVSKLFAAYWLYRFPDEWVGLNTYVADLSVAISSTAQEYFLKVDGKVSEAHSASKHWETTSGGGMWAAGVGGPITGKGFNLGIIDDPIKNSEESNSEAVGQRNRDWYQSTFYTREAFNHTCIIVMNTRWPGPGDIVGWLFDQEEQAIVDEEPDDAEKWHCVILPALYDPEGLPTIPATCTIEPDWRNPGDALFPERYGTSRLRKIKRTQGTYYWSSLYQQNPTDREGHRFKRIWFQNRIVDRAPDSFAKDVAYIDHGGGETRDNDPTAMVRMRRVSSNEYYIVEVVRFKTTPEQRDRLIRQTAERWGTKVTYWGMQEPGSAGKDQARNFRALLEGFEVYTERVTGEKEVRGDPFQAACEAGFVYLVRGPWNTEFLDELVTLWTGRHDDQGECAAGAYNKLSFLYRRKRKPHGSQSRSFLGL